MKAECSPSISSPQSRSSSEPGTRGAKLRVLIVDDALFARSVMKDILEQSGLYKVIGEATTGIDAVTQYETLRPDLVTMDVVMPGMNGIEACRQIMAMDPFATVVVCSALGQESSVVEAITAGARDFLVKPVTPERVLRTLAKANEEIG